MSNGAPHAKLSDRTTATKWTSVDPEPFHHIPGNSSALSSSTYAQPATAQTANEFGTHFHARISCRCLAR